MAIFFFAGFLFIIRNAQVEPEKDSSPPISTEEPVRVKVFFGNTQLEIDPQFDCRSVFSVEREVSAQNDVPRAALEELLKGLTPEEKAQGYGTSINSGVTIQRIIIENGTARVDFDEMLEYRIGGSCWVAAIRAQITKTLTQFPGIESVIISINGRTEDILQP